MNDKGEFRSAKDGEQILQLAESEDFSFSEVDEIGKYTFDSSYNDKHIDEVLKLNLVNVDLVKSVGFKVVVDAVNSSTSRIMPMLQTQNFVFTRGTWARTSLSSSAFFVAGATPMDPNPGRVTSKKAAMRPYIALPR